jgi:hypothetical protein
VSVLLPLLTWLSKHCCQNDLNGATPTPGPTMIMGDRHASGIRKRRFLHVQSRKIIKASSKKTNSQIGCSNICRI